MTLLIKLYQRIVQTILFLLNITYTPYPFEIFTGFQYEWAEISDMIKEKKLRTRRSLYK